MRRRKTHKNSDEFSGGWVREREKYQREISPRICKLNSVLNVGYDRSFLCLLPEKLAVVFIVPCARLRLLQCIAKKIIIGGYMWVRPRPSIVVVLYIFFSRYLLIVTKIFPMSHVKTSLPTLIALLKFYVLKKYRSRWAAICVFFVFLLCNFLAHRGKSTRYRKMIRIQNSHDSVDRWKILWLLTTAFYCIIFSSPIVNAKA